MAVVSELLYGWRGGEGVAMPPDLVQSARPVVVLSNGGGVHPVATTTTVTTTTSSEATERGQHTHAGDVAGLSPMEICSTNQCITTASHAVGERGQHTFTGGGVRPSPGEICSVTATCTTSSCGVGRGAQHTLTGGIIRPDVMGICCATTTGTTNSCGVGRGEQHVQMGGGVRQGAPAIFSATTTCTTTTTTTSVYGVGVGLVRQGMNVTQTSPATSTTPNYYFLKPALKAAFEPVGATDRPYTFKEVLMLLKKYLFSHTHLFDKNDRLWVNCANDPLGTAMGVSRFHYSQVKYLMSGCLVIAQRGECLGSSVPSGAAPVVSEIARGSSFPPLFLASQRIVPVVSDISRSNSLPMPPLASERAAPVTCFSNVNGPNDNTGLAGCSRMLTPPLGPLINPALIRQSSVEAGSSRGSSSHTRPGHTVDISIPNIPDSSSDVESVYSYQGYETAYCRNTEYETSDEEEVEVEFRSEPFEEYEVVSDDAKDEVQSETESIIEDVEVAVLAYALEQDGSGGEEADDSDTEDQSGDDPELVGECWDCLTCGVQNKPFVRYCDKCWQLRKNWLPDRPKRRKRKPRPKKRHLQRRTESLQSDDPAIEVTISTASLPPPACSPSKTNTNIVDTVDGCNELVRSDTPTLPPPPTPVRSLSVTSNASTTDSCLESSDFSRTSSNASTVSLKSPTPERTYPLYHNSQDSGISSSQDFTEEMSMAENNDDAVVEEMHSEPTNSTSSSQCSPLNSYLDDRGATSKAKTTTALSSASTKTSSENMSIETSRLPEPQSSGRKRRSSSLEENRSRKRLKTAEEPEEDLNSFEAKAKDFMLALQAPVGQEWLKSAEGRRFLSLPLIQAGAARACRREIMGACSSLDDLESSQLCSLCYLRPKNASIIHGRLSHQATCYQCARRLLNAGERCPVCRRKIHMVCKHILV